MNVIAQYRDGQDVVVVVKIRSDKAPEKVAEDVSQQILMHPQLVTMLKQAGEQIRSDSREAYELKQQIKYAEMEAAGI